MFKTFFKRLLSTLLILVSTSAIGEISARAETHNSLEQRLLAVQKGERPVSSFLQLLVDSEVVVLSKRDVLDQKTPEDISVLVLPAKNGELRLLAVFTSPDLASRVAKTYPEYRYGITTDFVWVLAHTSPGLGLVINPGWTLGMEIPSYGVLQMRERYAELIREQIE